MILLTGTDRASRNVTLTLSETPGQRNPFIDIFERIGYGPATNLGERLASFELTEANRAELKKWL